MKLRFHLLQQVRRPAMAGLFGCTAALLSAQYAGSRPPQVTRPSESGRIRIIGDAATATVVRSWISGFARHHPDVNVEASLLGTDTAMAGLWTGMGDIALMGRDLTAGEHDGHGYAFTYFALGIDVMNGSLSVPGKSHALVPYVHKDNPLGKITLDQLAEIFGTARRPASTPATWSLLGLTGEWADKPITGYIYDQTTAAGTFFARVILEGSTHWNWSAVREFRTIGISESPMDGIAHDADEQIAKALAEDRYGLGFTSQRYASGTIKALAVARHAGQPAFEATRENIAAGSYPLARRVSAYIHQPPGKPVDPNTLAFLRYVLSREGQLDVANEGDFLLLSTDAMREQLERLGER